MELTTLTHEKGWPERFLEALERTGNVSEAARQAGISRVTAYDRRRSDAAFAAAWEHSLEVATDALEAEARRRALDGVEEPVFYQGAECGRIRKYSDTLMIVLLKAHRPAKYSEKHQLQHDGQLTVRIEYADGDGDPAPAAPGAGEHPA